MAKRVYEENNIIAVANKIRELLGTKTEYTTYDLADAIEQVYMARQISLEEVKEENVLQGESIQANAEAIRTLGESKQDCLVFDGEYNAVSNKVATVSAVAAKIAEVIANAPADFDTLKEIANYIASDKTGAAEMSNRIAQNTEAIAALGTKYVARLDSTDTNLVYVERSKNRGPIGYKLSQAVVAYGIPERDPSGNINVPLTPGNATSATSKQYVDGLVGDVETALDSIIAMQESLIGGEA